MKLFTNVKNSPSLKDKILVIFGYQMTGAPFFFLSNRYVNVQWPLCFE